MKAKMLAASAIGAVLLWATPAGAQDRKSEGSSMTVTGCLAQGEQSNEYSIKDNSEKTYGLRAGSDVNLKAHLGHKVTITGTPTGEKKEAAKTVKTEESEHLQVSNLAMVSTTCP